MDVVIIGGGVAGLYCAYKLKQKNPAIKLVLLEKERMGGRMGSVLFQGIPVLIGAGVGRKRKDKLLIKLLQELKKMKK